MPPEFELPPETGQTFYENALLKADSVRRQFTERLTAAAADNTGQVTAGAPWIMADDSGIEVDALGGAPGIFSSRYAGENATDVNNVNKMLDELKGRQNRGARFICEIVCLAPDGREYRGAGVFEGNIATEPHGEFGFGYDPIFVPEGYLLTVSQLSAEEKNRISHRARAARNLLKQLGEAI